MRIAIIAEVYLLSEPDHLEIGVVAAGGDRLVPLKNTHLASQADHVIVPTGHTRILFRRDVADFVGRFLAASRPAMLKLTLSARLPFRDVK